MINNYYNEYLAKLVLMDSYPNKYKIIEMIDKPDLHETTCNIGIEVTQAATPNCLEMESLFDDICENPAKNHEKNLMRIKQLGGVVDGNSLISDAYESLHENIKSCICKKIEKLNKADLYKDMKSYELFIIDYCFPSSSPEVSSEDFLKHAIASQENRERRYSIIYIYTYHRLYILDIDQESYKFDDIGNNKAQWHDEAHKKAYPE